MTEIEVFLDTIKDAMVDLAMGVYDAQTDDGKIDWREALSLGVDASAHAMNLLSAFRNMSRPTIKDLIDTLANSDIVFQRGK